MTTPLPIQVLTAGTWCARKSRPKSLYYLEAAEGWNPKVLSMRRASDGALLRVALPDFEQGWELVPDSLGFVQNVAGRMLTGANVEVRR